ncbi:hypothetical protein EON65_08990 [archaeon]|nr:MAG: hypothetical protein EON65_08990 [archaeon]
MYRITPPLPLVKFETNLDERIAKTITGESLPSIPNKLYGSNEKADKINDPIQSRKLARWFTARSQQEVAYRQVDNYRKAFSTPELLPEDKEFQKIELFDCTVFESYLYVESAPERQARNEALRTEQEQLVGRARQNAVSTVPVSHNLGIADVHDDDNKSLDSYRSNKSSDSSFTSNHVANATQHHIPRNSPTALYNSPCITFDAEFESGNLEKAVRVLGRENLLTEKHLQSLGEYAAPAEVDQEYDLTIRNDINTDGNIQWYYFAVKFEPDVNYTFPLSVRLNLINMQKKDSLYNYGMKPAVYAESDGGKGEGDWGHDGTDICYYRNGLTNLKVVSSTSKKKKNIIRTQYSLSFTYTFRRPGTVYFAHAFPYTYSDLQRFLFSLESNDDIHRRALCETIAGNVCDVLTITERCENVVESKNKPAIILSARIHPGESMSSFMIQGCIEYLLSDCLEAKRLRKAFIFIVVPMLNPDGVVHGNYRCSLAGSDLNRRYKDANASLYPTITAFKELFQATQTRRPILLFLDLHGHSKVKNAFLYGCDLTYQQDKIVKFLTQNMSEEDINNRRLYARLYPKILCTLSKANYNGYFSYNDCAFAIQKNKGGTGRVFGYRECGIIGSYTIEASFCGNGDNNEKKMLKKMDNSIAASNRANQTVSGSGANAAASLASISAMNSDNETARSSEDINAPLPPGNAEYISDDNEDEDEEEQDGVSIPPLEDSAKSKPAAAPLTFKALLDRDPVLNRLINSYRTHVHYSKQDLLNMGRHVVYAIYHYCNLTHADLDEEIEQLVSKDKDEKDKISSQVEYENKVQAAGIARKERRLSTLSNSVTSASLSSRSGKGHYADPILRSDISSSPSNDSFVAVNKMQALELKLKASGDDSEDEDEEDIADRDGDAEQEENAENDDNDSRGSDLDGDEKPGLAVTMSHKLSINSSSKLNNNSNNAYLQEVLQQHLRSQVVMYDENNIAHKSLTRAGVLSVSTLSQLIQQYSSEFALLEKSTMNIGISFVTLSMCVFIRLTIFILYGYRYANKN